jgi:hypothetical protein
MTTPTHEEITAIVDDMRKAISAFNEVLARAHVAGLDVKVDSSRLEILGKRGWLEIYSAEISQLAFSKRV